MRIPCPILLLVFSILLFSCESKTRFQLISSDHSGVHFNNQIIENDSVNPLDLINIYNGGGVGIGDFNRDGLPDIYFTGNTVSNKLYLNKGNFVFEDITDAAGVGGGGEWFRGASVVDINNDGWPDIYVCATILRDPNRRRNLLYINQGLDKSGVPHFKEMSREYGLADTLFSTMAQFFDYDKDGDLDMYLTVNNIPPNYNVNYYRPLVTDGSFPSTGRLYRNDWNDSLKHPVFTDVSRQAGITVEGFGHDATAADINGDGWTDIYVSSDFSGPDILYINNHDGTFTNKVNTYFKHTSSSSMGQDIVDINNDGLPDVVELDMDPPDNFRKKMFLSGNNYRMYQNSDYFGYQYQYARNSLQLNQGPRLQGGDSAGDPIFSEISYYAGIEATDWSWTPLVADFDNDGYRDIIITNGYPRDVTDHDFMMFRTDAARYASKKITLDQIPQVKIHSFGFRNNGDLTFSDMSKDWGLMKPGFSNGAAYADLDGDGDMDLVVNNIDDEAHIYRNMSREREPDHHFLQIAFHGDTLNKGGFGAVAELHYGGGQRQVYENTPYRGYLSTIEDIAHFGLGKVRVVDTVIIKWPDGKMQVMRGVSTDQVITVDWNKAEDRWEPGTPKIAAGALFRDISDSTGIHFEQAEKDYIDFNVQKMLPHKFSEYGPGIAAGDINGDGLDDFVVGGSAGQSAEIFLQQSNGTFLQTPLLADAVAAKKPGDDLGLLLFDADGDGDLDLYITAGGDENPENSHAYQDRLYVNDGKGHFTLAEGALPINFTSKMCVRAADYNHDGKPDLFVSGRVDPGHYPQAVSSFIYRNDSKDGQIHFTDVTASVAPDLQHIGMVCDGIWSDIDNDGWPDLLLAGEWMPLTVLKNDQGRFRNITAGTGTGDEKGWWNSIIAGDFDNDGDIDYVVGNVGLNTFYRASHEQPVRVYGKDFDNNGIYDMVMSLYLPDQKGHMREFPAMGREDLLKQMNSMRKKFPSYRSFATATMDEVLTPEQRKGATILEANQLRSCLFRNDGGGKFTLMPLPAQAQFSLIDGMVADDVDGDGNLDLVVNANDYGTEVGTGRYDAMNGLVLKGDGKGQFTPLSILESGVYFPGNGKALVKLRGAAGNYLLVAGQNRGPLKVLRMNNKPWIVPVRDSETSARIYYKNGAERKEEFYEGASFLSQSGRFLSLDNDVRYVEIQDQHGASRKVTR
jgi:hypothetical protein